MRFFFLLFIKKHSFLLGELAGSFFRVQSPFSLILIFLILGILLSVGTGLSGRYGHICNDKSGGVMISAPDGGKFLAGPSIANLCRMLKARDPAILAKSPKECLKTMIEIVCELEHSFCDLELVASDVQSSISCLSGIRQVFDKARR